GKAGAAAGKAGAAAGKAGAAAGKAGAAAGKAGKAGRTRAAEGKAVPAAGESVPTFAKAAATPGEAVPSAGGAVPAAGEAAPTFAKAAATPGEDVPSATKAGPTAARAVPTAGNGGPGPRNGAPTSRVRVRDGVWVLVRTPVLRGMAVASCLYWTANAALTALLIPFVVDGLGRSGRVVGWLIAALGLSYLVGAAIARRLILRHATRTLLAFGYAAVGACFVVAFTATSVPRALVAVGLSGVPGAVTQIATAHRLQVSTPDAVLGRVASAFHLSDALAAVAGAVVGPGLLALAGLRPALITLSLAVVAAGLLAAALLEDPIKKIKIRALTS
ncbi:MFS transporter, partial [Asanoa sp. NPDC050611]|uniref:MFS transporter n=1 Tax=Asanoa sp. NPDC050611 TaxID=3157098 RepID=UPI0033FFD012